MDILALSFLRRISQLSEDFRIFTDTILLYMHNMRTRKLLKKHKKLAFGLRVT